MEPLGREVSSGCTNPTPPKNGKRAAAGAAKSHKPAGRRAARGIKNTLTRVIGSAAVGAAVNYASTRNLLHQAGVSRSAGGGITVTGTDYFTSVSQTAAVGVGDELVGSVFHMGTISTSRLAKFAQLYENYRVNSLEYHFESAVPTSQAGSFVMFFDMDPTDEPLTSTSGLANAIGHRNNVSGKMYEHCTLHVRHNQARRQDLLCTPPDTGADDPRDYAYGRFSMVSASALTSATVTFGNIYVSYSVTFSNPAYHNPLSSTFSSTNWFWGQGTNRVWDMVSNTAVSAGAVLFTLPIQYSVSSWLTSARELVQTTAVNVATTALGAVWARATHATNGAGILTGRAVHAREIVMPDGRNEIQQSEFFRVQPGNYCFTLHMRNGTQLGSSDALVENYYTYSGDGTHDVLMNAILRLATDEEFVTADYLSYYRQAVMIGYMGTAPAYARHFNGCVYIGVKKPIDIAFGFHTNNDKVGQLYGGTSYKNVFQWTVRAVSEQELIMNADAYASNQIVERHAGPECVLGSVLCAVDRQRLRPVAAGATAPAVARTGVVPCACCPSDSGSEVDPQECDALSEASAARGKVAGRAPAKN